jgi:hypothetical protein
MFGGMLPQPMGFDPKNMMFQQPMMNPNGADGKPMTAE